MHQPDGSDSGSEHGTAAGVWRHGTAVTWQKVLFSATVALLACGLTVGLLLTRGDVEESRQAEGNDIQLPTPSPETSLGNGAAGAPQGEPDRVYELADHPLLQGRDVGLPTGECELPPWQSTPEAAEEFFRAATECLDEAWEPILREHNLPFESPTLVFPSGTEFDSECGQVAVGIQTAAYYCKGELFLPYKGLQTQQYGDESGVYLALLAHEYGHHVQEVSGIMDAVWEEIYSEGERTEAGQEMSRRKELQAQCFSGMFLGSHVGQGSITREMYNTAWADQETRGDGTSGGSDHGSNENYAAWWRSGAQDNRIAGCNTFTAGSESVS